MGVGATVVVALCGSLAVIVGDASFRNIAWRAERHFGLRALPRWHLILSKPEVHGQEQSE
jgi:hypothetical protein